MSAVDRIANFFDGIVNGTFFSSVSDIFGFLTSAIGFLYYSIKTLLVGIRKLLAYVFEGGVFLNVGRAFVQISDYIGGPATIFLSALLFLVIIRIIIAFILRLLRRNVDYHTLADKSGYISKKERFDKVK